MTRTHNILIEVVDDGVGIAPELQPKIFDAFEQGGRAVTSKHGGLGLGLAISKRVIDLHGGTISVTSLGRRARRDVHDQIESHGDVVVERAGPTPPDSMRVSLRGRIYFWWKTTRIPHTCSLACWSGPVTRSSTPRRWTRPRSCRNFTFDLVISDVGLPDGSGLDLMSRLRERYSLSGIALSGFGMDEDRAASEAAGFAEHLTKPVDVERLRNAIERLMTDNHLATR